MRRPVTRVSYFSSIPDIGASAYAFAMTATRVPAKFESMFGDVGIDPTFEAIADESGVGVEDARGVLTGAIDDAETVQKIADTLCIVPEALADRIADR